MILCITLINFTARFKCSGCAFVRQHTAASLFVTKPNWGQKIANPFTIQIFSTTGDPERIRIIEKTNWSGVGIAFPREEVNEVIKEEHAKRPGVYMLVGDLAEETIYIGEADPISDRLKQHKQKDWSWGVFFVDSHGLGKTEVQFLESELVRIAQKTGNSILMNRNAPNKPHMSRQSQAAATVFLNEMLSILPMIGIRAFTKVKTQAEQAEIGNKNLDTLVVPAKEDGFKTVFLGESCWYAIRINSQNIPKLKYIAVYQVAPISAITHIAEIAEITPYQNSGKYLVKFKSPATEIASVSLQPGKQGSQPQSPRYTSHEKILSSKYVHQLWE